MPASADTRAHGQRDSWFIWHAATRSKVTVDGADSWPLAKAEELAERLGAEAAAAGLPAAFNVLHTLTWVDKAAHAAWAKETDYGNRPGRNTMPK